MIKLFGVYVSKAIVLLGVLECVVFFLSLYGAVFAEHNFTVPQELLDGDRITSTASLYAIVMFSSILALGLYQPDSMV